MKRILAMIMLMVVCVGFAGCGGNSESDSYSYDDDYGDYKSSYSSTGGSSSSGGSFTNKYGNKSTKCAEPGCNNNIASSGDTWNCTTHSNKCLECRCYIDGDASYCMSCLGGSKNSSSSSSSSSGNKYGHDCYVCGKSAYSKYGSYYYCSSCLALVKAFS